MVILSAIMVIPLVHAQTKTYILDAKMNARSAWKFKSHHPAYGLIVNSNNSWSKVTVTVKTDASLTVPAKCGSVVGQLSIYEAFVDANTGQSYTHKGNNLQYYGNGFGQYSCKTGYSDTYDFFGNQALVTDELIHGDPFWHWGRRHINVKITLKLEGNVTLDRISGVKLPGISQLQGLDFLFGKVFLRGADLSSVKNLEDEAIQWTAGGSVVDPYELMADYGSTVVRLKVWVNPKYTFGANNGQPYPYSSSSNIHGEILRAKAKGLKVLLAFHLSDTWADPGNQITPASWSASQFTVGELDEVVYNYIKDALTTLNNQGALPQYVQIGNETRTNLLLPQPDRCYYATTDACFNPNDSELRSIFELEGPIDAKSELDKVHWDRQAPLFNAALSAVKDNFPNVQTVIHMPGPYEAQFWADQAFDSQAANRSGTATVRQENVDVIGMSYYQGFNPGKYQIIEVSNVLEAIHQKWNKETLILETGYPQNYSWSDNTTNTFGAGPSEHGIWPAYVDPAKQLTWMTQLREKLKTTAGNIGFVYWEPFLIGSNTAKMKDEVGSPWENLTLFDFEQGVPLNNNPLNLNGAIQAFCDGCQASDRRALLAGHYFESGFDGWSDGGTDVERVNNNNRAREGNHSIRIRDNSGTGSSMTSPSVNLSAYNKAAVTFHYYSNGMESNEDFWLQYYDGSSWQTVKIFRRGTDFENNAFHEAEVIFGEPGYNMASNAQIRFRCDASDDGDEIYIDAVNIYGVNTTGGSGARVGNAVLAENVAESEPIIVPYVFPNPAQGGVFEVVFGLEEAGAVSLELSNLTGQVLFTDEVSGLNAGNQSIVLSKGKNLPSGVYMLNIRAGAFNRSLRVIIKR